MENDLARVVRAADDAINREDFDTVVDFYSEDAVLVVRPGMSVAGKVEIRRAMERIADYFNHSLHLHQDKMTVIEAGDTALVLAKTIVKSPNKESEFPSVRKATYVFKRDAMGAWRCVIDNSYGTDLLD
jgi:uncharacterized protein (TIGR02246 family)